MSGQAARGGGLLRDHRSPCAAYDSFVGARPSNLGGEYEIQFAYADDAMECRA